MKIKFNGESLDLSHSSLQELLTQQNLAQKLGIAVAINGSVVPKSLWTETEIKINDDILVITAAAGG
ncbi:MAG: sulfur carrier protein [Psychromonas sp.]|jgi:sulfur carrier protein